MSKKKEGQSRRDPKKTDLPPQSPVEGFDRTRRAHRQERAQDYVELISSLIAEKGEARAVDLARSLGVSHVTVTRTLKRLQKAGWVTSEPYRAVFLTPAGEKLADASRARHKIVLDFLLAAGVPASIAHIDAEGIEHHVSPETLAVMENLAKRLRSGMS